VQKFFIFFSLVSGFSFSQTVGQCRQRFDSYLNFKGALTDLVKFENDAIYILNAKGEKELAVYAAEIVALASFFENTSYQQQEQLMKRKGIKRFTARQRDSLLIYVDDKKAVVRQIGGLPLQGFRVAIDPGHFSTTLKDALIEQRYLYFVKDSIARPLDTIKLFESELAFNTAKQLQAMLESKGAKVLLTRDQNNHTSFNCSYDEWMRDYKNRTLDSLKVNNVISEERRKQIATLKPYKLFWNFFHDYDINNRAKKINQFNPHVSVIIHYNVDELNNPWLKTSNKNFTMAFIAGAFTADNLSKTESKIHFLRLLLTEQLNQSEALAKETVKNFSALLKIPIATETDAIYLKSNCISTKSEGVFSRNLILCRKVNSPLVYGESLYQDNVSEAEELMKTDFDAYGIKSNIRLNLVAKSYYTAVFSFLSSLR